MFWGGKSNKAVKKQNQNQKRRKSRKAKKSKKLNKYFTLMLGAKKNNLKEFNYNGKKYVQKKLNSGLVTYARQ